MSDDGSMSADEYLRRAAELNAKQKELQREQAVLNAHAKRAEAAGVIDMHRLIDCFYRVVHPVEHPAPAAVIDYLTSSSENPANMAVGQRPGLVEGADIQIRGIHNLPTRPRFRPSDAQPRGSFGPSSAMRLQQESGRYPTLEEHLARDSVAFEPFIDEFGRLTYRQLTREEEDAIRTGSNRDSVR